MAFRAIKLYFILRGGKWGVTCSDVTSLIAFDKRSSCTSCLDIVNPFSRISGFIWKKITNEMKYQLGLLQIIEK